MRILINLLLGYFLCFEKIREVEPSDLEVWKLKKKTVTPPGYGSFDHYNETWSSIYETSRS